MVCNIGILSAFDGHKYTHKRTETKENIEKWQNGKNMFNLQKERNKYEKEEEQKCMQIKQSLQK